MGRIVRQVAGHGALLVVFLIAVGPPASPHKSKLDLSQRFLILDTRNASAMEEALSEAASAGYRVVCGFDRLGRHTQLLEKQSPPASPFEYRVWHLNSKELNRRADAGFRVLPRTVGAVGDSPALILERTPGSQQTYEYLAVDAMRIATLQKELTDAVQQGYRVIGLTSGSEVETVLPERRIVLERLAGSSGKSEPGPAQGPAADADPRYLLLHSERTSTMQERLADAAAKGYRLLVGSDHELAMLLEKASLGQNYQYMLLATTRTSTLEKELNESAARGYRLRSDVLGSAEKNGIKSRLLLMGNSPPSEIVAVMEKAPGTSHPFLYHVRAAARISALRKELDDGVQQGYIPVGMTASADSGEFVVVLEKAVP